mmetsp:Transcript_14920/g.45000  ORF Transcript_14920/g.45000 Transcript_14920/m.45000 type:complete len:360 (+) Transcript_14920:153-1232(+)
MAVPWRLGLLMAVVGMVGIVPGRGLRLGMVAEGGRPKPRFKIPAAFEPLARQPGAGGSGRPTVLALDFACGGALSDYDAVWALQRELVLRRLDLRRSDGDAGAGDGGAALRAAAASVSGAAEALAMGASSAAPLGDCLLLVEHPSTYTLGTGSTEDNLNFSSEEAEAHRVVRTERGGEVTWHGPGQLVVYPILDLNEYRWCVLTTTSHRNSRHTPNPNPNPNPNLTNPPASFHPPSDLHWYVRALEELVIRALGRLGVADAGRIDGLTGVWVDDAKVAAIGVKVKSWVTMHGVAINVDVDLGNGFNRIVPCGIGDRPVTRVADLGVGAVPMEEVKAAILEAFAGVFEADIAHGAGPEGS